MSNTQLVNPEATTAIETAETQAFTLAQRQATALSKSSLVPKDFQGNVANCLLALNMAQRLKADPFMVMQSLFIIHGRPSFSAQFLIAMVNASGRFTPLQFKVEGDAKNKTCVAYAKSKDTGEVIEGPPVSFEMAKAEGWSTKNGSKWATMPDLMLRYRAAAFFARLYAPDITLGMQTTEELLDVPPRDVTPKMQALPTPNDPFAPPPAPEPKEEIPLSEQPEVTWDSQVEQ